EDDLPAIRAKKAAGAGGGRAIGRRWTDAFERVGDGVAALVEAERKHLVSGLALRAGLENDRPLVGAEVGLAGFVEVQGGRGELADVLEVLGLAGGPLVGGGVVGLEEDRRGGHSCRSGRRGQSGRAEQ